MDAARRHRLGSDLRVVREGVRWELWLEARLEQAGAVLELHPEVPGLTRRPDLRATRSGTYLYVEATATGGGDLDGHRQATATERIHDVLMSRLKHKSRAFQGIDGPLLVAVCCVAAGTDPTTADAVATELFAPENAAGRNVSAVLVAWDLDPDSGAPGELVFREHPRSLHAAPKWLEGAMREPGPAKRG